MCILDAWLEEEDEDETQSQHVFAKIPDGCEDYFSYMAYLRCGEYISLSGIVVCLNDNSDDLAIVLNKTREMEWFMMLSPEERKKFIDGNKTDSNE